MITAVATSPRYRASPFSALYSHSLNRIWSGRAIRFWEVFSWTVLAIYLGFRIADYRLFYIERGAFIVAYLVLFILTPLVVPAWVYRTHMIAGAADEFMKTAPVAAFKVLGSRFVAILVTWLRIFGPWIVVLVLTHEYTFDGYFIHPFDRWKYATIGHLLHFPYLKGWDPDWLVLPSGTLVSSFFQVLAVCNVIGWLMLPIAWGFLWGTIFRRAPSLFLLGYVTCLPLLGLPAWYIRTLGTWMRTGFSVMSAPGAPFWRWTLVTGLSGLILAIIAFLLACKLWGARSR